MRPKTLNDPLTWLEDLPCSVMVCDRNYKVLYMNDEAAVVHKMDGGKGLIGSDLMDCHPPEAQEKLREVMDSGRPNAYTIEKHGVRRQIFQCQWRKRGKVAGLIELSFAIPRNMPHHKRD